MWMSRHESINKVWEERKVIPRIFGSFKNHKEILGRLYMRLNHLQVVKKKKKKM